MQSQAMIHARRGAALMAAAVIAMVPARADEAATQKKCVLTDEVRNLSELGCKPPKPPIPPAPPAAPLASELPAPPAPPAAPPAPPRLSAPLPPVADQ